MGSNLHVPDDPTGAPVGKLGARGPGRPIEGPTGRATEDSYGFQQRLAVALDSAGIGSWELDLASGEFRGDARLLELFGFAADSGEMRLSEFSRRLPREDRRRVSASLERSIADGSDYAEEYRVLHPDGSTRWVAAHGRPLYDDEGAFDRLVGSAYDTTPRHDAAARADSDNGLLALIASASVQLASSLETSDAVRNVARLVVPRLADWSIVTLVNDEGVLEDVEWWHRDPDKVELTRLVAAHRLEGRDDPVGALAAFSSAQPWLISEAEAEDFALRTLVSSVARDAILELGLGATAVFPLITGAGEVVGLITLSRERGRDAFTDEESAAVVDLCRRVTITLENAQSFGREREMSEELQRSMLTEPVQPEHVEVVVRYVPAAKAAQVGGDWYDAFAQDDGSTVLVVGDVVGHDSVAAAVMGQLRSMLRGMAVTSGAAPAQLLGDLDRALVTLQMLTNATVVVARVESAVPGGPVTLRWSNAGHPPPLVADPSGEVHVLSAHDALLGLAPELPRTEQSVTLTPGSTLVLYTDGLVERRGEDIDEGIERLRGVVARLGELPLGPAVDRLMSELVAADPDDDVVLLAMRLAR